MIATIQCAAGFADSAKRRPCRVSSTRFGFVTDQVVDTGVWKVWAKVPNFQDNVVVVAVNRQVDNLTGDADVKGAREQRVDACTKVFFVALYPGFPGGIYVDGYG